MNIVKYAPKTHMDRFFDTDHFINDFWPWAHAEGRPSFVGELKVNVVENEDNYTLTAEVPGLTEKDLDIEIKNGQMTLKGNVEQTEEKEEKNYRMREFSRRSFERSFTIGEGVDQDNISAKLDSGILKLVLPKKEEAKPKTVKVAVGS